MFLYMFTYILEEERQKYFNCCIILNYKCILQFMQYLTEAICIKHFLKV